MATKKTVLQYVQSALSIMDSDLVDSIEDTVESRQVADLLYDLYFEFINRQEWSWLKQPVTLLTPIAPGQSSLVQLKIPDNVKKITYLAYDSAKVGATEIDYKELHYLDPIEFIKRASKSGTDRILISVDSFRFYVDTKRAPEYWTSFDDEFVVVDAYDSEVDLRISPAKMSVYGVVIPEFLVEDSFVPDLPVAQVSIMQHTLNAAAKLQFKQDISPADEARTARQLAQLRREESKTRNKVYYNAKYGRK